MKLLVCLRYGIGDLVMELPALSALREALPGAEIVALAASPAHELLEGDPRVDRLVVTSRWGLTHRWDTGDEATRETIADWARRERFDRILDLGQATEAVSMALEPLDVPRRDSSGQAESQAVVEGRGGIAAIRAAVRVGWGIPVPEGAPPEIRLRPSDVRFAADYLDDRGLAASAPPAISPVASHGLKRWPFERFAAVADELTARTGSPVLLLQGPQQAAGEAVVEGMARPVRAARVGAHHLLRTAALLERCALLVSNDTGLMHVAAAVGTPVVGVFGPTRKGIYLPPWPRSVGVEPRGLECPHRQTTSLFPPECWVRGHCLIAERGCIHQTPVEEVLAAADQVLTQTSEEAGLRAR